MTLIRQAAAEVLRRETAANKTPQGACIASIIEEVAHDMGVTTRALSDEVIRQSVMVAN